MPLPELFSEKPLVPRVPPLRIIPLSLPETVLDEPLDVATAERIPFLLTVAVSVVPRELLPVTVVYGLREETAL